MAARKVDAICQAVRDSPEKQGMVAEMFNDAAFGVVHGFNRDADHSQMLAVIKTLKKPEFSEIKERFLETGKALNQAVEGFAGNQALFSKMAENPAVNEDGSPSLFVRMKPENAELLVCDPNFMDPLVKIGNLPPIDPRKIERFEKAVNAEESRMAKLDDQGVVREGYKLESFGNELLNKMYAPKGPGQ